MEDVSNEAKEPAKARHEGVWLELPPALLPPPLSVVVNVLSEGSLLKIAGPWIPLPSTDAADPDRKLPAWLACLWLDQLTPAEDTEWWETVSLRVSWSLGDPPLEMELLPAATPVRPRLRLLCWGREGCCQLWRPLPVVVESTSSSRDLWWCLERLRLEAVGLPFVGLYLLWR